MTVKLYRDFSDKADDLFIENGLSLKDAMKENDFSNKIIICNGKEITPDYTPAEKDLIFIRSIPHDMSGVSTGWRVVVGVLTGGIDEIINMGVQTAKNKEAMAQLEASLSDTTASGLTSLPTMKGASNSIATGKTQPYYIGRSLMTPYILNGNSDGVKGFHTFKNWKGTKLFYNVLLEGGFNKQIIEKVFCKNSEIKNFQKGEPQEGKEFLDTSSLFNTNDSFIEIAQDGQPLETENLNRKIIEQAIDEQLGKLPADITDDGTDSDDYTDLFYTLEKNSRAADICIMFNGLCFHTDSGTSGELTRHIMVYYSLDYAQLKAQGDTDPKSHATWKQFYFTDNEHHEPVYEEKKIQFYYDYYPTSYNSPRADLSTNDLWRNYGSWVYEGGESETKKSKDLNMRVAWIETKTLGIQRYYRYHIELYWNEITQEAYDIETSTQKDFPDASWITGNFTTQARYNAHVDFTYNDVKDLEYPITLRIGTVDRKASSGTTTDDLYIKWIHSYIFNKEASAAAGAFVDEKNIEDTEAALSTLIGLQIEATQQNSDKIDCIQVIASGIARTWDGEAWTTEKTATSNPAAWELEVLTSNAHVLSQVDDDEIDLDSFGEWYTYCANNDLEVNTVVTAGMEKDELLSLIATVGNAVLYRNIYGKIAVAIDDVKENAIAVYNANNIVSISYNKTMERSVDGVLITYVNADEDFSNDTYLVMKDGKERTAYSTITEQTVKGITKYEQIVKYGRRYMAKLELQPKTVTLSVGKEGIYFTPYSKILLQHASLKIGLGFGEIKALIYSADNTQIVGIKLYDPVEIDTTNEDGYGVVINAEKPLYKAVSASSSGLVDVLNFTAPFNVSTDVCPRICDVFSYGYLNDGEFDTITSPFSITGIEEDSNNNVKLTLVDYNAAIYESGTIPEYKTNITEKKENITTVTEAPAPTFNYVEKMANTVNANVSKLFNTQLITLYRASASVLTSDDLPTSALKYNFSTSTPSWENPDTGYPLISNGWTWTYPTDATTTVYTTVATAQAQDVNATIAASSWASPIASGQNGTNGMNAYTLTLYRRATEQPTQKPSALTYHFDTGAVVGSKNGWLLSIPAVDEENNPVWEIHASALSETMEDTIEPTEWTDAAQITSDGITEDRVKEIVQEEMVDVAETPNVYADYTSANFAVNSAGRTVKAQEVTITVHVLQTNEELDFTFDETKLKAALPSGFSYQIDNHSITIKVNSGIKVVNGSFIIPILYKSFKYNNVLGYTIDGEEYQLAYGTDTEYSVLGYKTYYDNSTEYELGFTYAGIKGGVYLGKVAAIADIPADNLIIGDYITWTGTNTASELAQEGSFKQCAVYVYSGDANSWRWERSEDTEINASVISDVMSVVNADLENNNSTAYEYLSHLTANSVYADLFAGNEALINKIVSSEIVVEALNDSKASAENEVYEKTGLSALSDKTIISGGFLKTSLIDADTLLADYVKTTTLESDYLTAAQISADYLKTSQLTADYIHGITGVFKDIEVTGNSKFAGELQGATGDFKGRVVTGSGYWTREYCRTSNLSDLIEFLSGYYAIEQEESDYYRNISGKIVLKSEEEGRTDLYYTVYINSASSYYEDGLFCGANGLLVYQTELGTNVNPASIKYWEGRAIHTYDGFFLYWDGFDGSESEVGEPVSLVWASLMG